MINALTIDLEPWYANEFLKRHLPVNTEDQIEEAVAPILELLDRYNTKATFFVLGIVANKYPQLIENIHNKGHEIGSHAYSHKMLSDLGKTKFEDEIRKSVDLLKSITGKQPLGFRAPSFSLNNSTKWALEILKKNGFRYDSSIFPTKTILYGVPNAPLHPYRPSTKNVAKHDPKGPIVEFPMTVIKLGKNIPISGGFYLRVIPSKLLRLAIKQVNKTRMAVIYIHPWETYPMTPRLQTIPPFSRFVSYYGINSSLRKITLLLDEFKFQPLYEFL